MRRRISEALIPLYGRAARAGMLDRPLVRRAFEATYLTYKRLFEAGPFQGLRGLVGPGTLAIDVGANIGFFSVQFARWVGPSGRVIAVEPEELNMRSLRRRVAQGPAGGVVDCVQAVAADRAGEMRLALTPGHPGDHHLAQDGEPVPAVTLDALAAGDSRSVSLVKIDVQGAEMMVIAGARSLITTHRPAIYLEVDGPALERLGSSPRELIQTVMDFGYRPRRLARSGPGADEELDDLLRRSAVGYIDVLFLPV